MSRSHIFDTSVDAQAKLQPTAVGQSTFPMITDLPVTDKCSFIFAKVKSTGLWHEFFPHLVDESVLAGKPDVFAIGRDAMIAAPLDECHRQIPPITQRTIAATAFIVEAQRRRKTGHTRRQF